MCFIRAGKHLHIGGWDRNGEPSKYKGGLEYHKVKQAMRVIEDNEDTWDENFDLDVWLRRYGPRIARAPEASSSSEDVKPPKEAEHSYVHGSWEWKRTFNCVKYGDAVQEKAALCCPEDVWQDRRNCNDHSNTTLCPTCSIPVFELPSQTTISKVILMPL